MTDSCDTCACQVVPNYCSRQKDMSTAPYKQCDGWQAIIKKVMPIIKTNREERLEAKHELVTGFSRFLAKGGHFSFRENKLFELEET